MGFTENQRRAIEERGNIIVSAGAGSGKTTVMIARILEKLKSREATLDRMLIVTFTRSAAADMRVKLTEKLYELKADSRYADIASDALDMLPACNIGTLHSYCQRLVKTYFYAAGLDPSAVICDAGEADGIKLRAVSDAVSEAWQGGDPHFAAMYDMLGSRRSDDGVKRAVSDILEFALTMPDPRRYLTERLPDAHYFAELDGVENAERERLQKRIAELKKDLLAAGMTKHATVIDEFYDCMDGVISEITRTSHTARGDVTDELNERFKALKKDCKDFCELAADIAAAKSVDSEPYSRALLAVAHDAYKRYAERKANLGKLDYSDLEHGAYAVLSDGECLSDIVRDIRYVFIDEFQDVNPLQSAIADKFRQAGAEMFVVGDVKQSIYGFRRCSPQHFIDAIASRDYKHVALADNFRSSAPVISFINRVFDGVMTADFGGVDYRDADQRLRYGNAAVTGGEAAFYTVPAANEPAPYFDPNGYSVKNAPRFLSAPDAEAAFVADRIVEWIAERREKDMDIGSIAVLLPSEKSALCGAITAELDKRGIKYSRGRRSEASAFADAVALVDILRCADNRFDDVALYTALRSPMGGFSDAEISEMARSGEKRCRARNVTPLLHSDKRATYLLWQKLENYDGELKPRADRFSALREKIIRYAQSHDAADTLGYITANIDYFQYVYERGGNAAAVDALIGYAAEAGCDAHTLIDRYDAGEIELSVGGQSGAVTVSTMHASKGLEYDLVIAAGLSGGFAESDRYGRVVASERGVFVKVPREDRTLAPSAPWLAECFAYPDRARAEELRLLYVALTRAKTKLVVCAKDKPIKSGSVREATCMRAFMQNVAPLPAASASFEIGEPDPDFEPNAEIEAEVLARHRYMAEHNAEREKNKAPIKACVTAVAHESVEHEDYTRVAPILTRDDRAEQNADGGDAMLRGTAYHKAMELIDFDALDAEQVKRVCDNAEKVDFDEILAAASIMRELTRGAAFVAKERYFIVNIDANELYGDKYAPGNGVLVQGVIDLLIVDKDGSATVVDYKTGARSSLDCDAYRTQLKLYARAVEQTTPYKVVRTMLYSFSARELITVEIN